MSLQDNLTDLLFIESTDKSVGGAGGSVRKKYVIVDTTLKDVVNFFHMED